MVCGTRDTLFASVRESLHQDFMTWHDAYTSFEIDRSNTLLKTLSTIKGLNFPRCGYYFSCIRDFAGRGKVNNLTELQVCVLVFI